MNKKIIKAVLGGLGVSIVLAALFPSAFLTDDAKWTHQGNFGRVDVVFAGDVSDGQIEVQGKSLQVYKLRGLLDKRHNQGVVVQFPASYLKKSHQITLIPQGKSKKLSFEMRFRGEWHRINEQVKPVWVRFENIRLNGNPIAQEKTVWHNKPFIYRAQNVEIGQSLTLNFDIQKPFFFTDIRWERLFGLFILCSLFVFFSYNATRESVHNMIQQKEASIRRPRAHYIDLVRGICAVSIVFIHTCFWSGSSYVPMPMRSISLLLDVPAFFFIAGMTRAYIQKDTILTQLFKLSMIFVLLGFLCNLIDGGVTWTSIFRPLFLMGLSVSRLFGGAAGSYWFVPVYACTIILGGVIIKNTGGGYIMGIISLIVLTYVLSFGGLLNFSGYSFLGCSLQMLLFPVASYLFGYWCQQHIIQAEVLKRRKFALLLAFVAFIVFHLCYLREGSSVYNLQINKFPPKLPYIAASCLSMSAIIFFANNSLRNRFFEHIGRNAIFYYAGQGVSASLISFISPHIRLEWGIKLPIMFAINLALAIIFSEALRLVYTALASAIRVDKKAFLRRLLSCFRLTKAEE